MSDYVNHGDHDLAEMVRTTMDERASAVINEGREAMIAFLENDDMPVPSQPVTIEDLQHQSHETAVEKGWWDNEIDEDGEYLRERVENLIATKVLLMVSELCEAFEEFRSNRLETYWVVPGFGMVTERLVREMDQQTLGTLETCMGYGMNARTNSERRSRAFDYLKQKFKPEGFGVELGDALIRQFDLAEALTRAGIPINLQQLVLMKAAYNKTRPYRHGGKRA